MIPVVNSTLSLSPWSGLWLTLDAGAIHDPVRPAKSGADQAHAAVCMYYNPLFLDTKGSVL